jgi:hypothetical protein
MAVITMTTPVPEHDMQVTTTQMLHYCGTCIAVRVNLLWQGRGRHVHAIACNAHGIRRAHGDKQ